PVVAVEPSDAGGGAVAVAVDEIGGIHTVVGLIDGEIHIQIAVVVIIEEAGHGRLHADIETIFGRHIFKMRYAFGVDTLVDVKNIPSAERILIDGIADVDIHQAIVVDIDE